MADTQKQIKGINIEEMKKKLLELRSQLEHDVEVKEQQVAENGDDLVPDRGGVSNHMADDANETSEQATMLTLQHNAERQIDHVNEALARIEEGKYGTCTNCGQAINPDRLEALPFSTLCINCQNLSDRGQI